jgi:hypothetical protein
MYEFCEAVVVKFMGCKIRQTCILIISTKSIWEFLFSFREEIETHHKSVWVLTHNAWYLPEFDQTWNFWADFNAM